MRVLLLMRGAPGAGKSTFIKKHGLDLYKIEVDSVRNFYSNPVYNEDGKMGLSGQVETKVWKTVLDCAELRFKRGDFVVVDATNKTRADINQWKKLAKKYLYRIYLVDMTGVPKEVAKAQNLMRSEYKQVPEEVIDKAYEQFETETISAGISVIPYDQFKLDDILWHKENLSKWNKIKIIGDIHGCKTVLDEAIPEWEDDTLYIFVGDLADRGTRNAEMVQFWLDHYNKPNFLFIEGNHERHLRNWANDNYDALTKGFKEETMMELIKAGIDKAEIRKAARQLQQCLWFRYWGKEYFVSHGGISVNPNRVNPLFLPTRDLVNGTGRYGNTDKVMLAFNNDQDVECYQIFGHRGVSGDNRDVNPYSRSICLESGVERGERLSIFTVKPVLYALTTGREYRIGPLDDVNYYTNHDYKWQRGMEPRNVHELLKALRSSKYIKERKFGSISSFNFTEDAFREGKWDNETVRARGIFIDTEREAICARSYDKFFNIGERPETEAEDLAKKFVYPVHVTIKDNGFLGIVGWDYDKEDLLICTKGSLEGQHVDFFKEQIERLPQETIDKMKETCKTGCSMIFEVIDHRDPHIVDYLGQDTIRLLDIVTNTIRPSFMPYEDMFNEWSQHLHIKVQADIIKNSEEAEKFFKSLATFEQHEGYVFRDSVGFMVKLKTDFYLKWKYRRRLANLIFDGKPVPHKLIENLGEKGLEFFEFLKAIPVEDREKYIAETGNVDLPKLRKDFYKEK